MDGLLASMSQIDLPPDARRADPEGFRRHQAGTTVCPCLVGSRGEKVAGGKTM